MLFCRFALAQPQRILSNAPISSVQVAIVGNETLNSLSPLRSDLYTGASGRSYFLKYFIATPQSIVDLKARGYSRSGAKRRDLYRPRMTQFLNNSRPEKNRNYLDQHEVTRTFVNSSNFRVVNVAEIQGIVVDFFRRRRCLSSSGTERSSHAVEPHISCGVFAREAEAVTTDGRTRSAARALSCCP